LPTTLPKLVLSDSKHFVRDSFGERLVAQIGLDREAGHQILYADQVDPDEQSGHSGG